MNIAMFDSRLMSVEGKLVRVTAFPQRAFGHTCIDMQISAALARREKAALVFIPCPVHINEGLFSLAFDGLEVLCGDAPLGRAACRWWDELEQASVADPKEAQRIARFLCTDVSTGQPKVQVSEEEYRTYAGWPYYRRRLLAEPSKAHIPEALVPSLRECARALGIADDARIVSLHVRDRGWYQTLGFAEIDTLYNTHRCADIANYVQAVDWLVSRGFTVVRMGDAAMRPFSRHKCIDLATSPERTDILELDLLSRSEFAVTGESGPTHAAMLLDRPVLIVNIVCPAMGFPVRADSMAYLKGAFHKETGRALTLAERFAVEFKNCPHDTARFEIRENTPEELLAAVREMVAFQEHGPGETVAQRAYSRRVHLLAQKAQNRVPNSIPMFLKWGPDQGFLGAGRMCEAWLEAEKERIYDEDCGS